MATIRKRTLPSGKAVWQADYKDGGGKRRHRQFAKKSDADAFLTTARGEVAKGVHVAASASVTVDAAAEAWLGHAEKIGRERATVRRYRDSYEKYVKPRLGGTKLSAVTAPMVQRLIDDLTGTMALSSLKKVKGAVVSLFKHAVTRGQAAINPARDVILPDNKRTVSRPEYPTKAELRAILEHAIPRWRPLFRLATVTGMRASELRGLLWTDVDLEAGVIHVRRRVDMFNQFGPPKSKTGTRDIPISPATAEMLTAWQAECPKSDLGLVFPTLEGAVTSHANIQHRAFWPAQIRAGVSVDTGEKDKRGKPIMDAKYSLHALRHAAAALFIEQGFAPKRVQALMGHASLQMTYDTYGYLFPNDDDDRAKLATMESALLG
ncbi:MAG: site-specific integrase [Bosea sp.]|uniref:tyrosine-type recombinase/integrase n=1 Tax=Bosea sp. (in: a-proteobacteria) TaxID=1871050 RepID=UPI001AD598D1|nr:tyrosine-type recombinase/integrase [Bosea sp. (in: a-proteobacteria)]MBN9470211.1 site-specific integrase [Bosea sp. (in: a-proteobacteria)]